MNDATLERLMMDAALGAINEDVQELLMAHLTRDAGKAREAEELRALVERMMTWGGRIVAMAACLLIGFGVARMRPARQVEVVVREKPATSAVVAVNDTRPTAEGELWSAHRIYRNAIEVNRNEKPRAGTKRIFQ
jgi:hypothetical protein